MSGPAPQRRPGDSEDFVRQRDPNAAYLGEQSADGNTAGLELAAHRVFRWLLRRGWRR